MATATHYPIRAAARLTGLSVDTLRAWERRYQAVTPLRGERGRLYDQHDIERLKQLARLVDRGHAISVVAALSPAALTRMDRADRPQQPPPAAGIDLAPLMRAMRLYDVATVEMLVARHAVLLPPPEFIFAVVIPALREIGARWESGGIRPAQEHLVAAVVRSVLGGLLRTARPPETDGATVFAATAGERHELGLLSAAVLAAHAGRRVVYLGPDVPAADIVHAVNATNAATLVLCATMPDATTVRELRGLRRVRRECELWVGGSARARIRRELGSRTRTIETLEAFSALL